MRIRSISPTCKEVLYVIVKPNNINGAPHRGCSMCMYPISPLVGRIYEEDTNVNSIAKWIILGLVLPLTLVTHTLLNEKSDLEI
jgi:hypothetical protein